MTAVALGVGYALWNIGILHGNVTVLAAASYFTPVLYSALAAMMLNAPLSFSFWQGAVMVCGGSLLCWWSTCTPSAGRCYLSMLHLRKAKPDADRQHHE